MAQAGNGEGVCLSFRVADFCRAAGDAVGNMAHAVQAVLKTYTAVKPSLAPFSTSLDRECGLPQL